MISATVLSHRDIVIVSTVSRLIEFVTARNDADIVGIHVGLSDRLRNPCHANFMVRFSFRFPGENRMLDGSVELPLDFSEAGCCRIRPSVRPFQCLVGDGTFVIDWVKFGKPGWVSQPESGASFNKVLHA